MIASKNRAWYMGCSDADRIVGNMETETWNKWWSEKLGLYKSTFSNKYTMAGTMYEHKILKAIDPEMTLDHQIIIPELCVRANYDGIILSDNPSIHEVKTFNADKGFKLSKTYWRQAQMEMWAAKSDDLTIHAYPLTEEYYNNYWLDIEKDLIENYPVERDNDFIDNELVPRIKYLAKYLKQRRFPERSINE